ncbi:hypothetical protein FIBSPDRAFT_853310 [Athelia psychrophila]|uniref:G domain-containing protein n=1 Tax=Athelia psychrophila TaxID=1759441 RepID=A0A166R0D2_9AGAM|nr:hypothetical protein FIBSPDRAFT_853310 [Fibularhizoctonia sp. CBS 109695]
MLDGGRKEVAKTSNDIVGCTFKSEPYNVTAPSGQKFTLWDTAGLDEGPTGRVKASAAISNIRELTRQLAAPTGLSLIIYVVRGKILSSTQKNYLLFKAFCDSKVPFVLVVTGLDDVSNRAIWWEQNKSYFHRADLFSDGHACIVSSERRRTEKPYMESVKEVFDLIETTCPRDPWKADNKCWFIQTVVNVVGVLVASLAKTSERSNVLYRGLVDNGIEEGEAVVATRTLDSAFQPPPSKTSHQVKPTRHSTYDNHHELVSSRSQSSGTESSEKSSHHLNQESRMGDISGGANVIIFGQSGSGKSSLVNMIAGRDVARISASTVGCTASSQSYDVDIPGPLKIKLWDTAGLNESNEGSVSSARAIAAICKLVRDLELDPAGLSLLVYCVRGRIHETTVMNYNMIRSVCHGKIPIALVVTGLEHEDRKKWWDDNQPGFTKRGMDFEHHACVVTCKGPKRDGSFLYAKQHEESTQVVQEMIRGVCQPK